MALRPVSFSSMATMSALCFTALCNTWHQVAATASKKRFVETLQVSARKWTFTLYHTLRYITAHYITYILSYIYIIIYMCVCVDLYPFVYLFIFISLCVCARRYTHIQIHETHAQVYNKSTYGSNIAKNQLRPPAKDGCPAT